MVAWCRNNPSLVIQSGAKRVVGEGGWKLLEAEAAVSAVLLFVKEVIVMYCAVMCYLRVQWLLVAVTVVIVIVIGVIGFFWRGRQ